MITGAPVSTHQLLHRNLLRWPNQRFVQLCGGDEDLGNKLYQDGPRQLNQWDQWDQWDHYWLVVWKIFYFPLYIIGIIIPSDSYFSEG